MAQRFNMERIAGGLLQGRLRASKEDQRFEFMREQTKKRSMRGAWSRRNIAPNDPERHARNLEKYRNDFYNEMARWDAEFDARAGVRVRPVDLRARYEQEQAARAVGARKRPRVMTEAEELAHRYGGGLPEDVAEDM